MSDVDGLELQRLIKVARDHVHLDDPSDPYPAELVGQLSQAVVELDRQIDEMGTASICHHAEYKQRRNAQFEAYERQRWATVAFLLDRAEQYDNSSLKLPLRTDGLHEYDDGDPPGIDFIRDATGGRVVVADSGVYPPNKPDADLIVAAVNALPQLIAIAEAAQAWHAEVCDDHGGDCRYDPFNHAAPMCKLLSPPQERHE